LDFGLTSEQERFRGEVCAFLSEERVRRCVEQVHRLPPREEPGPLDVYRWLGERGWLAVSWPEEYGGGGRGLVEKSLLTEELILHGVPEVVHTVAIDIVGTFLLAVGTPRQKRDWLPPLARGEQVASVLFSEPGVGSDLAALRSRAEPDGDGWRLFGRKVFNMKTHLADVALCAVRTTQAAVPFHGITLFMVPLKTPGVIVKPLWNLSDERFGDVTLDGIRLDRDHVVGEVDEGWQAINQMLRLERTGIEFEAKVRRLLDVVVRHAAASRRRGDQLDQAHMRRLVELDAAAAASRLLAWRVISGLRHGEPDDAAAMSKWYSTELNRKVVSHGLEMMGLEGTLSRWDDEAPVDGLLEAAYREAPGLTIASGTSEIMLYIIAASGLDLLA
jgi:alkylation response protein AidB-like acyl-CoA dehydrogenase